jgi:hypothetical protein
LAVCFAPLCRPLAAASRNDQYEAAFLNLLVPIVLAGPILGRATWL